MEMILLAIIFAPFIIVASYITLSILVKMLMVIWADAFSLMGWNTPKEYMNYYFNI